MFVNLKASPCLRVFCFSCGCSETKFAHKCLSLAFWVGNRKLEQCSLGPRPLTHAIYSKMSFFVCFAPFSPKNPQSLQNLELLPNCSEQCHRTTPNRFRTSCEPCRRTTPNHPEPSRTASEPLPRHFRTASPNHPEPPRTAPNRFRTTSELLSNPSE